jgi:site-specific recombinase XerD
MVKYLTKTEERELLKSIKGRYSQRDKAIIKLAVNTGLRVSELCGLTLSDVNKNGRAKDELTVRKEIAKGKRERTIPLNDKAKQAIEELLEWNKKENFRQSPGSRLIISQKGEEMTRQQIQRIIKQAREEAGLDIKATPHTLRHTFATNIYGKTNNLRIVQKLLGHRSIKTTEIYADVTREQLKQAVNGI